MDYKSPCLQLQLFWAALCIWPQGCDLEYSGPLSLETAAPLPAPPVSSPGGRKAGPFLRKSSLSKHWISFKKEAHVFSRTGFIVFVIVLCLFRSSSVKASRTLTFPAIRDVSSTLIQAFYYFFPLRMVINCGSLRLLCWCKVLI